MKQLLNYKVIFLILFLLTFSLLFLYEGPFLLTSEIANFSSLIPSDLLVEDSWYGIYFQDNFVGYSHYFMKIEDEKNGGGYLLKNTMRLSLPVLGSIRPFNFDAETRLSPNYDLRESNFKINSQQYFFDGFIKKQGSVYFADIRTPGGHIHKTISIKDELPTSLMSPLFLNYVPLKKKVTVPFYDPFLDKRNKVILENKGRKKITLNDKKIDVYVIKIDVEGVKGEMIVDSHGRLIQEEFLGFRFAKEEMANLLLKKKDEIKYSDLIDYFSIKTGELPDKDNLKYVKLKIKGIAKEYLRDDFNQKVYVKSDSYKEDMVSDGLIVEIHKKEPSKDILIPLNIKDMTKYLQDDEYIKFNSPEIRDKVRQIIGEEKNSWIILTKLSNWIDKNITKTPTISLPNTLDVLKIGQGDCGEISALMAGFLRSAGIPSYVNVGVVYQEGAFFYHAWVSVYINEWFDTDPALSQLIADPTHIKLLEGFENQFELFKIIGNLNIEILEYK